MTKRKGAATVAAPAKATPKPAAKATPRPADPAHCPKGPGGIHHWIDEVHGNDRIRTTVQRCQACGRKVKLGTQEV